MRKFYTYIEGYGTGTVFSREQSAIGGICIRVKQGIEYIKMTEVKKISREHIFKCCEIELCASGIVIVAVYRTPSSNVNSFLSKVEDLLKYLSLKSNMTNHNLWRL